MGASTPFRVAAVEFNPEMFEFDRNLERACAAVVEAADGGAQLIVLPEAALSGYIYRDLEQFLPFMDTVPGRGTAALETICRDKHVYVAIGIAEIDRETGLTYNTGALIGPDGYIGKYRKNGLNPSDILWFTPGNTGYPVFDTELGRITMVICYDDTYWEAARLPAVKGADLVAYICSSDRVLTQLGPASQGNHSTIAAVQQLVAYNGLAMVAADRSNAETNPTTGITVVYGGSASIWQADGRRTGHLPATSLDHTAAGGRRILYGEIDPALYDNAQRRTLARRRPELYGDLAFFRSPTDSAASSVAHQVRLVALQYENSGTQDAVIDRLDELVASLAEETPEAAAGSLVVMPAFSLSGRPRSAAAAASLAEKANGRTVQVLSDFAVRMRAHVVGSHVERDGDALYHTAVLVGPQGRVIGSYRQTHLDPSNEWATAGDALPVFATDIGRIGLLLDDDVRFPEASGVLSTRRADLIAVPSAWDGTWGGPLQESEGLFAHGFPPTTMSLWYALAKTTQAYAVVANPVGDGYQGASGVFTINPVDAEPPVVASSDATTAVTLSVTTLGDPSWWMDQRRLIGGRRPDLTIPLTLSADSAAFERWRKASGWDASGWAGYAQ